VTSLSRTSSKQEQQQTQLQDAEATELGCVEPIPSKRQNNTSSKKKISSWNDARRRIELLDALFSIVGRFDLILPNRFYFYLNLDDFVVLAELLHTYG